MQVLNWRVENKSYTGADQTSWINLLESRENMLRMTKISFRATGIALKKVYHLHTVIAPTAMVSKRPRSVVPMRGRVGFYVSVPLGNTDRQQAAAVGVLIVAGTLPVRRS